MQIDTSAARCAAILNRAWWVRHYFRPAAKVQRRAAISALGLAVRQAFAETDDFEPILRALVDGLAGERF